MFDALPTHPTLTHPLTGEPLRAVGIVNGRTIWPILGGDENAGAGSGDGGTGTGAAGDGAAGGSGTGGGAGAEGAAKTFTQDDVDKLISERLTREKSKYSDYDQVKAEAEKWRQAEADKAPEIEKIRTAALAEGRTAAAAEAESKLIGFAARAALAEAKAVKPATAVKTLDVSTVKLDKDGNVDEAALKAAIEALKKSDPYLFAAEGSGTGSHTDAGIGAGGGNGGQRAASLSDAINNRLAKQQ